MFARVKAQPARLTTGRLLSRQQFSIFGHRGFTRTAMAEALAVVEAADHGFVARNAARNITTEARDVEHDSVSTNARKLHGNKAWRAWAVVAGMRRGRMTARTNFRAWMRTDQRRGATGDGRFLYSLAACADNVVEVGFQTAIAATLVTRLLAAMDLASEGLVASLATHVVAFRVGLVPDRRATLGGAMMLSTRLDAAAGTETGEASSECSEVGEDVRAFHGFALRMAATGYFDIDLARFASTRMALLLTLVATGAGLSTDAAARRDRVEARFARLSIDFQDGTCTASAGGDLSRLEMARIAGTSMTNSRALMVATIESTTTGGLAREEAGLTRAVVFLLIWRATRTRCDGLSTVASLFDLVCAWSAGAGMTRNGAFVTTAVQRFFTRMTARLAFIVLPTTQTICRSSTPTLFDWAHRSARRARARMALQRTRVRASCS